ncbi:type VII secretion protein EccE, partial [Rhodococcus sp. WS4]
RLTEPDRGPEQIRLRRRQPQRHDSPQDRCPCAIRTFSRKDQHRLGPPRREKHQPPSRNAPTGNKEGKGEKLIKLTTPRVVVSTATITAAATVVLAAPDSPLVQAAAVAIAMLVVIGLHIAPQQFTLLDRYTRRRQFAKPVRHRNICYSTSGIGVVWDGENASMYVAIKPSPFHITVLDSPDASFGITPLPVDLIRNQLTQGDIRLESITVIGSGYRRHRDTLYNATYARIVGDTPIPDTLRTVIEVKLNLERSHQSVLARATNGSVPVGAGKAVSVGAARLERELRVQGYEARLLRASAIRRFHDGTLAPLNDGFKNERWSCVDGSTPSVATKPNEWTTRAVERWFSVPADRMAHSFTISHGRRNRTHVDGSMTYTYPEAAKIPVKPLRLRRADGTQGDTVTAALPLAKTVAPRSGELVLRHDEGFPLHVPAFGLGVYLGPAPAGGRVFMNFDCGGEALYVSAPSAFLQQLATRITTTGSSVGVHMTGDGWDELPGSIARGTRKPLITIAPIRKVDVAIHCDGPPAKIPAATAAIVWTPTGVPTNAVNTLIAGTDGVVTITTPDGTAPFIWEAPPEEINYIRALNPDNAYVS